MQLAKKAVFAVIMAVFCLTCCKQNREKRVPQDVRYAMDILWDNPDSTRLILESVSPDTLTRYAAACYMLNLEHSHLKTGNPVSINNLQTSLNYFQSKKDRRHAGEAAYVLGTTYDVNGDHYMATRYLKQAESLLFAAAEHDSVPPVLLGMVCYKQGMNFESDWLYSEANACYRRALPYLKQTDYHLYIACTLRDMARTTKLSPGDLESGDADEALEREQEVAHLRDSLFGEALREAALLPDTAVYLDILDYAISFSSVRDTTAILGINRYMTNVLHQPRYAGELTDYYLSCNKLDSARLSLELFAQDTMTQSWSRDRWQYLHSRLLLQSGKEDEAYEELENLYQNRQRALVRDGQARTYAIARQYDVLREKEKNLHLTINQQRLYIVLAILLGAVVAVVLLLLLYRQRGRRREALQQAKIEMLDSELKARRESLRRILSERVELTKKMQMAGLMQGRRKDELPAWAQQFLEQNLITQPEQWDAFLDEFNAGSSDLLLRLKKEHPQTTKTDLLIIALILTEMSIQDICILLNQTKHTIWSRRLRIKTHLGLTETDNLDEWLHMQLKVVG